MRTYGGDRALPRYDKRGKLKVGDTCWGTTQLFDGLIMCEIETLYTNSAQVKIIVCQNEKDDFRQRQLGNRVVIALKGLVKVRKGEMAQ